MHKIVTGNQVLGLIEKHTKGVQKVWMVSPFISEQALDQILKALSTKSKIVLTFITKWNPIDLLLGYSDLKAFELIFSKTKYKKWQIRVLISNNLHAKVFMLGKTLVVIGSMNLTNAGFVTNAELGIAILGNDSKFKTLENRLKEIESHSYELTPEAYSWKIKHDLPRYESRTKALKSLRAFLAKERDRGLESFVPGVNRENNLYAYFTGLANTLNFIIRTTPNWERLRKWLDKHSTRGGGEINQSRIDFMSRLGLIYGDDKSVHATPIGKKIATKLDKHRLKELLFGEYPEFYKLMEYLPLEYQHPAEISKLI